MNILVTGGNNGIGYEIVKALLESHRNYRILMGSRSLEKAKSAIEALRAECPQTASTVEAVQLDLTSDDSIEKAVEHIESSQGHLDTLVNNAGAAFDGDYHAGKITLRERFTKAYDVNLAGTHVLTDAVLPLLLKSADPRLIFVSGLAGINQASEAYYPTPPQPAGWPKTIAFDPIGYRCTKVALNMLMLDWNHKLKADGVKVWAVGPGLLATDLGNAKEMVTKMGAGHPSIGGRLIRTVVEGERDADIGKLIGRDGILRF